MFQTAHQYHKAAEAVFNNNLGFLSFIEILCENPSQEGDVYLEDLVKDIVQWLHSSTKPKADGLHGNGLLLTSLSQYYFLFLGTLSAHRHGVKVLEKGSVYQWSVGVLGFSLFIKYQIKYQSETILR